jgi:hypothetical protein
LRSKQPRYTITILTEKFIYYKPIISIEVVKMAGLIKFDVHPAGKGKKITGEEVVKISGEFAIEKDGKTYEFIVSGWALPGKEKDAIEDFKKEMERSVWLAPMLAFGYSDGVGDFYILYEKKGEFSN